ncbi:MAG: hypothetical protein ACRDO4_11030 [Nocardioides sp.]
MSRRILSKADVDAYVTIALRWTERGEVTFLPQPARSVLAVTRDTASDIGQRLWYGNVRGFIDFDDEAFDDDPGTLEDITETRQWWESVTPYVFDEFPGDPHPETVLRRVAFYTYQSAGDDWEDWFLDDLDGPPFEAVFTTSMRWHALRQLGLISSATVPDEPFAEELQVELTGRPIYDASGWGLTEDDRDLFLRLA